MNEGLRVLLRSGVYGMQSGSRSGTGTQEDSKRPPGAAVKMVCCYGMMAERNIPANVTGSGARTERHHLSAILMELPYRLDANLEIRKEIGACFQVIEG